MTQIMVSDVRFPKEVNNGPIAYVDLISGCVDLKGLPVWRDEQTGRLTVGRVTRQSLDKDGKKQYYTIARVGVAAHTAVIDAVKALKGSNNVATVDDANGAEEIPF